MKVTLDASRHRAASASSSSIDAERPLFLVVSLSSSQHEDCIEQLDELLPDSMSPSCAYSFFISQNWEGGRPDPSGYYNVRGRPHPDNKLNTKVAFNFVSF
jgi:hypothetical protein